MTAAEEARYVRLASAGDEGAFEALVLANQKMIYNTALKITGSPDDALDISQDTFLKAYQNLKSFRGESRFSAWLYRLCYNASMDFLKKNRRPNEVSMTAEDGGDIQYNVPDPDASPEEQAERNELRKAVRDAVNMLPDDKREIIVMREFSGMSYADIAAALGIEEGTVKSRLNRAKISLAEILRESGTFPRGTQSNSRKGGRAE